MRNQLDAKRSTAIEENGAKADQLHKSAGDSCLIWKKLFQNDGQLKQYQSKRCKCFPDVGLIAIGKRLLEEVDEVTDQIRPARILRIGCCTFG